MTNIGQPFSRFAVVLLASAVCVAMTVAFYAASLKIAVMVGLVLVTGLSWFYAISLKNQVRTLQQLNDTIQQENAAHVLEKEDLRNEMLQVGMQNKTRSRLFASTAHDLRQPLYALKAYASLLDEDPEDAPEITPNLLQNVDAVISMFDMMFDMSKLTEGFYVVKKQEIQIPEFMRALNSQYGPTAASKEIDLRFRSMEGVVISDRLMLGRLLGNLISNAIKFTPEHGGVLVACRSHRGHVVFSVYDTGVGISPEEEVLIFEEFYKSTDLAGTNDGFGLGLSIVNQFATLLNIRVSLISILGRGTRFTVELPKENVT